jgi:pyrophosphatase PpaX
MFYSCLLIDHDDTMLSTFGLRAEVTAAAVKTVFGEDIDGTQFLSQSNGRSLQEMGATFSSDPALVDQFVKTYRAHYYEVNTTGFTIFDGIPELLSAVVNAGLALGVVTSKLGSGARAELEAAKLVQYAGTVVGAEDVTHPKPSPEPLQLALERLGKEPRSAMMVGDTSADILGAKAAGVVGVAALWGTQDREALLAAGPDHIAEHPRDVLVLLGLPLPGQALLE